MPGIKNTMKKTVGTLVSHSRETGSRREVLVVKESICQCRRCKRHVGLILRSERSPGEGHGNPCLYSCLENSMDRGDWRAVVRVVTKSQTRLSTQTQQHVKETSEQLSVWQCTGCGDIRLYSIRGMCTGGGARECFSEWCLNSELGIVLEKKWERYSRLYEGNERRHDWGNTNDSVLIESSPLSSEINWGGDTEYRPPVIYINIVSAHSSWLFVFSSQVSTGNGNI